MAPGLDVVIVSYRCAPLLRDCLRSLRDHAPSSPISVHVVDNASGDGSAQMVAEEFPEVLLTAAERNLGFSAANNIAIREGSAPYVLALNPDTEITAGALDRLIGLIESKPEIGIVGPRLELPDGSFDHASRRSSPTPLGALGHFTGLGRHSGAPASLAQYRAPEVAAGPVDAVNGAFMLIRRSGLEAVGLFDEGYWMYMEDLDLCWRVTEAGWTTWYEPSATVIHVKAASSGGHRSLKLNHAFHYGMHRFYRSHCAADRNPLENASIYAAIWLKFCVSAARSALARARA